MNARSHFHASVLATAVLSAWSFSAQAAPPLPGAVFTSNVDCTAVNLNIYDFKADVYLNGGPDHPGAAGLLPNTLYYVQVTDPSGATVLGSSVNMAVQQPVSTNNLGNFSGCYQLQAIVGNGGVAGFNDTPNPGGEYKVWVSTAPTFVNNSTKTDNFKVRSATPPPPEDGKVTIKKWYDRNADGVWDFGEIELVGWKVDLLGFAAQNTIATYSSLALIDYTAEEFRPTQSNWYATNAYVNTPAQNVVSGEPFYLNKIGVSLTGVANEATVYFGNVCTGPGGGLTLGYWSNKNGQATMTAHGMTNALAALSTLNLANYNGTPFDPASYSEFRSWLLGGNAVNMAYMLSVQLAAMKLNVITGKVSAMSIVYAPGAQGANSAGFININDLINEANTALGDNSLTWAGIPARTYQEYLKTALDDANNNKTFAQYNPCSFTFANPVITIAP